MASPDCGVRLPQNVIIDPAACGTPTSGRDIGQTSDRNTRQLTDIEAEKKSHTTGHTANTHRGPIGFLTPRTAGNAQFHRLIW